MLSSFVSSLCKVHKDSFLLLRLVKLNIRNVTNDSTKLSNTATAAKNDIISVFGNSYKGDEFTNVTSHILSFLSKDLHHIKNHPLHLIKQRIIRYMYGNYVNWRGTPLFSVYDRLLPVVTIEQNFDSLLVPPGHPSRSKSDSYYLNSNFLLRPHTSAHQHELIKSGLDHFLVIGDVYRRDEIDSKHYPVFHQCEGVRLLSSHEVFNKVPGGEQLKIFENVSRDSIKQGCHTLEAVKVMEKDLKDCLSGLVKKFFGKDIEYKWTESYFPFTHPSWELEILHDGEWLEILGCGIMEQEILNKAGATEKIGWAFGIGLERLAMRLYDIPDVRLFWSQDSGFLSQFDVKEIDTPIQYKEVSKYPQCTNDISFWVPKDYHPNDFYDIARSVGGEIIEQVYKVDEFFHPKHKRQSFCYRIVYRHMERTLTQKEVNAIHKEIEVAAVKLLKVEIR
ncbi:probable phenylalanine--tRNA ligase, mitochondrial [Parasteatoda tepidariorum]|uniref:probable phenylalanine--tRNA ligase, mitochondrial n=1 Tax=Parasteatoda tepidariorum TaxID=114398 RepID=UPI001C727A1E|nr:probable phenylalanine--tRNA ligase, mitochondrial [Parasteatoda tepidariorum]